MALARRLQYLLASDIAKFYPSIILHSANPLTCVYKYNFISWRNIVSHCHSLAWHVKINSFQSFSLVLCWLPFLSNTSGIRRNPSIRDLTNEYTVDYVLTMCPRSLDQFHNTELQFKMSQHFLDIQYLPMFMCKLFRLL